MKKILLVLLALTMLVSVVGCSTTYQTVQSTESNLTLEFPSNWEQEELNGVASIEMCRATVEQYVVVIEDVAENYGEGFTLDDFAQASCENTVTSVGADASPAISTTQIADGIDARQYDFEAQVDGLDVKFYVTCFQNDTSYYQVMAWSLPDKFDAAKPVFDTILDSAAFV